MISQEPRNDCLGLKYPGQYTLKLHAILLHYLFLKIFNVSFIDSSLCQQCYYKKNVIHYRHAIFWCFVVVSFTVSFPDKQALNVES